MRDTETARALAAEVRFATVVTSSALGRAAQYDSAGRVVRAEVPAEEELDAWYGPHTGVGLVSGGLEMFEIEGRAVTTGRYRAFLELAAGTGLADLVERIRAG